MNSAGNTAILVAAINNVHEEIVKLILKPWDAAHEKLRKKVAHMKDNHN